MAKNKFKKAVESTSEVSICYKIGLSALKMNSSKVRLGYNSACSGSVDIDQCLAAVLPQSNRWDYCFSYKEEVFFIEVHSARSSEVNTVINKLNWLKDWLRTNAPEINKLQATSRTPFYWIQKSNYDILPNSPQYRRVIQAGIKPISILELP